MTMRRFVVPITVDAGGDAEVYSPRIYGYLETISYVKTDFANGVDFVCTLETTAELVWSEDSVDAAAIRHPRAATHSTAGAAALYAGGGTAVARRIAIGGDRIKIVVDGGGVSKTGTLHFTVAG